MGDDAKVAEPHQLLDETDDLAGRQPALAGDGRQIQERSQAIVARVLGDHDQDEQRRRTRGSGLTDASPDKAPAHAALAWAAGLGVCAASFMS
jgi:hypothetical protein